MSTMRSQSERFQEKVTLKSLRTGEKENRDGRPPKESTRPKLSPPKEIVGGEEENIYHHFSQDIGNEPIGKSSPPTGSPELGAESFVEGSEEEAKRKPAVPRAS